MGSIPVAGAKKADGKSRRPFWHPHNEPISASVAKRNWVRIPHPKIDKLACQAQGEGIFTAGEIPVDIVLFFTIIKNRQGLPSCQ